MADEYWAINLKRLQDKDLRIRDLETHLSLIPPEKIALKNKAAANRAKVEKAQKVQQDLELQLRRSEAQIADHKENIRKLETQSNMVKKNTEYQAMLQSIAELKKKISDEESLSIDLLDRIDGAKKLVRSMMEDVKAENASLKMEFIDLETLAEDIRSEITSLRSEREKFIAGVNEDILNRYELLLKKGSGIPLAPVREGICGNCHLKITPQTLNNAMKNEVVFCDNCQHFIYMED